MTRRKGRVRADVEHVMVCSDVHVPFHDPFAWAALAGVPARLLR